MTGQELRSHLKAYILDLYDRFIELHNTTQKAKRINDKGIDISASISGGLKALDERLNRDLAGYPSWRRIVEDWLTFFARPKNNTLETMKSNLTATQNTVQFLDRVEDRLMALADALDALLREIESMNGRVSRMDLVDGGDGGADGPTGNMNRLSQALKQWGDAAKDVEERLDGDNEQNRSSMRVECEGKALDAFCRL